MPAIIAQKTSRITRLLLALLVLQSIFVAVEASADSLLLLQDDHHQLESETNITPSGQTHLDSCDHCCNCQGHGSHTALVAKVMRVFVGSCYCNSLSGYLHIPSFHPETIYRPPII